MSFQRVTIIGIGLLGGSVALAFRRHQLAERIVGCDVKDVLLPAMTAHAIDEAFESPELAVKGSNLVVLCAPPQTNIELLEKIAPHLDGQALVTDVGSTKADIASAAKRVFGDLAPMRVLPGHPLAGKEVSGFANASALLFTGAVWALTPLEKGMGWRDRTQNRKLVDALEAIGARVLISDPEEHDHTLAYTSHLPQMVSTALALLLQNLLPGAERRMELHGTGLRDMMRLAKSDGAMWEQIAKNNTANIAEALKNLEFVLHSLREELASPRFRDDFDKAREFAIAAFRTGD